MKNNYLFITYSLILMVAFCSCGNQEPTETRNVKKVDNEVSCFVQFADKWNSPRSVKIISNTKQLLFDRYFIKNTDGMPVEVKISDKNTMKHHFYDAREAKNIDNTNVKRIELIFHKPGADGRDKISIHIYRMEKSKKIFEEIGKGGVIYFPSDFEFKNGVPNLIEEEVESRLADIIIKHAFREL